MNKFMTVLEKGENTANRIGRVFLGAFLTATGVALSFFGIKTSVRSFKKEEPAPEVPETPAE